MIAECQVLKASQIKRRTHEESEMISQEQKEGTRTTWFNLHFNLQVSWLPALGSAEQLRIKPLITPPNFNHKFTLHQTVWQLHQILLALSRKELLYINSIVHN